MSKEKGIKNLRNQYMVKQDAGDIESCVSLWSDKGVLIPPKEPIIIGKEAIRFWYRKNLGKLRTDFKISFDKIMVEGDWGFAWGSYVEIINPKEAIYPILDKGKYLEIYTSQLDGLWKFWLQMWRSDSHAHAGEIEK